MEYAFARSDQHLMHPDFDPVCMEAFSAAGDLCHWTLHMNWILQTLQALPEWMAKTIVPGLVVFCETKVNEAANKLSPDSGRS